MKLTDFYKATFDDKTWQMMEMTPGSTNNKLSSGKTGVILYRELEKEETGYEEGSNCWVFRYRKDSTDTAGVNDTQERVCR